MRTGGLVRRELVLLAVSLSFVVVALESGAWLWERQQARGRHAWELVASRRLEWDAFHEPGAGFTLMKPGRTYEWRGVTVEVNGQGLRGPSFDPVKGPGVTRILNLGDSVAMGWGVEESASYGRQLARLLSTGPGSAPRYEVINAGVPGWAPQNALAYLRARGLSLDPDVVVYEITLVNDVWGRNALIAQQRPTIVGWLRSKTYLWPFLAVQLRWAQAALSGRKTIDVLHVPDDPGSYFPLDPEHRLWDRLWASVSTMNDLARQVSAEFVLVLVPTEFQVVDDGHPPLPQEVIGARATAAGIPLVDLLPPFREACKSRVGGTCQRGDGYLFADVWMHPSRLGHRLAAQELAVLLESR